MLKRHLSTLGRRRRRPATPSRTGTDAPRFPRLETSQETAKAPCSRQDRQIFRLVRRYATFERRCATCRVQPKILLAHLAAAWRLGGSVKRGSRKGADSLVPRQGGGTDVA